MGRKKEILADDQNYFKFSATGNRGDGPWVQKKSGAGRVLSRLLYTPGNASLEDLAELSGWKHPEIEMKRLSSQVARWSKYEIKRFGMDDHVSYRIDLQ